MFYAIAIPVVLAGAAVLYFLFHKKVEEKVLSVVDDVKDEVGEVKQAAADVKKDLSK
jgi:hypothetical protein